MSRQMSMELSDSDESLTEVPATIPEPTKPYSTTTKRTSAPDAAATKLKMTRHIALEHSDSDESLTEVPATIPEPAKPYSTATKRTAAPDAALTKPKKTRRRPPPPKNKTLTVLLRQFLTTSFRLNVLHVLLGLMDSRVNDHPSADEKHLSPIWACLRKLIRLNAQPEIQNAQPQDPDYSPLLMPLEPSDKDLSEFDSNAVYYSMQLPNKMAEQLTALWHQYRVVAEEKIMASSSSADIKTTSILPTIVGSSEVNVGASCSRVSLPSSIDTNLNALLKSIQTISCTQFNISTQENGVSCTLKSGPVTARTIYQFSEFPYDQIQEVLKRDWWKFATTRLVIGSVQKDDRLEKAAKVFLEAAIHRMNEAPVLSRECKRV